MNNSRTWEEIFDDDQFHEENDDDLEEEDNDEEQAKYDEESEEDNEENEEDNEESEEEEEQDYNSFKRKDLLGSKSMEENTRGVSSQPVQKPSSTSQLIKQKISKKHDDDEEQDYNSFKRKDLLGSKSMEENARGVSSQPVQKPSSTSQLIKQKISKRPQEVNEESEEKEEQDYNSFKRKDLLGSISMEEKTRGAFSQPVQKPSLTSQHKQKISKKHDDDEEEDHNSFKRKDLLGSKSMEEKTKSKFFLENLGQKSSLNQSSSSNHQYYSKKKQKPNEENNTPSFT